MRKICPVFTERDEIIIRGKKLYWDTFIHDLDCLSRRVRSIGRMDKYLYIISEIQSATDSYYNGKDRLSDDIKYFLKKGNINMPDEDRLPEAVENLFCQLEQELSMNLSDFLDECEKNSEKIISDMKNQIAERRKIVEKVRSLINGYEDFENADVLKKVTYLINLEQTKNESTIYSLKKSETDVTCLWAELLIRSISMDTVTQSQVKKAVENDVIEECDISQLLRDKYDEKKDYEWYMEDFLGCEQDETTIIKINDFLELCETGFKEILNLSL